MNKPLRTTRRDLDRRTRETPLAARVRGADRHRARRSATARASRSSRCTRRSTGRGERYDADVGFPGQPPYTRGIYATMHRGRTWTQRQLIGLGTPPDYNARLRDILAQGATAVSLIPCNSVYRGYDMDEVHAELLGTCGVVVNTAEHMDTCLDGVDLALDVLRDERSVAVHAARVHAGDGEAPRCCLERDHRHVEPERLPVALRRQPHVLPHRAAGRAADPRSITSTSATGTCRSWNPLSVVGQHMQQAGATPAEAMAFTFATAIAVRRRLHRARHGSRTSSCRASRSSSTSRFQFFEEIAKFRAGRRIWARLARERLGAKDPRSWRFKFHAQTSGVDLTRQQPLNNVARVTAQAMAGIFGGLQSLHTDAYDEALSCPTRVRRAHRGRDAEHPARGSAPDRRDRPARRLAITSRR